jgi:hypothetical protein
MRNNHSSPIQRLANEGPSSTYDDCGSRLSTAIALCMTAETAIAQIFEMPATSSFNLRWASRTAGSLWPACKCSLADTSLTLCRWMMRIWRRAENLLHS